MATLKRGRIVVATVAALAVAAAGVGAVRADPSPSLPPVAPDRLLASTLEALARPFSISGGVTTRIDLGLPELPGNLGGGVDGPVALLLGEQRYRVWRSSDGLRVSHLLAFREQVFVAGAAGAWWWDSQPMTATRLRLGHLAAGSAAGPLPSPSPGEVLGSAYEILERVEPYAEVSVEGASRVAGRPVYELVLRPTSDATRIGRIVVAIDAPTRLPLRYAVFPRGGGDAAIEAAFTDVSFDAIDASMFAFTPPAGATVRDADELAAGADGGMPRDHGTPGPSAWRAFGDGFDLRFAVRLEGAVPDDARGLLPYAGPLASVIAVERGSATWVLFGPVGVGTLEGDAATLP
jgi:hypothetical protein